MTKLITVLFFWIIMALAFPFTVWVIEILRHVGLFPSWL
jgi:hypothetical protein